MKYVRWFLLLLLLICGFKGFSQHPFFKELPMLLLPEPNSDMIMKKADYSAYDDLLDPRPICIQTQNNFSHFSQHNIFEENRIILRLKSNLSLNGSSLSEDKIITTTQKDFLPEATPVWATKHTRPLQITESPKPVFVPKG